MAHKIRFKPDFYDKKHEFALKKLVKKHSGATAFLSSVSPNLELELTLNQFMLYAIQKEKRTTPSFETVRQLRPQIVLWRSLLLTHYDWDGNSLQSKHVSNQSFGTEMLGVGFSLVMMGCLFDGDIAAIDWSILPVGPVKALNFMNAVSSASFYVQVECKGSVTDDPTLKSTTVSGHKGDIEKKKVSQSGVKKGRYAIKRFGTIAAIPSVNAKTTRTICWLLDPPAPRTNINPIRQRIINRLQGYAHWLNLMAPESHFVEALANRNAALEKMQTIASLDSTPLFRTAGSNSSFGNIFSSVDLNFSGVNIPSFFTAISISAREIFLLGITKDAINMVAQQRFQSIFEYRAYAQNPESGKEVFVESKINSRHIFGRTGDDQKAVAFRGSVFVDVGGTIFGSATVDEAEIDGNHLNERIHATEKLVAAEYQLKRAAMKELVESRSYASTHTAVALARQFISDFTIEEVKSLCDAAQKIHRYAISLPIMT